MAEFGTLTVGPTGCVNGDMFTGERLLLQLPRGVVCDGCVAVTQTTYGLELVRSVKGELKSGGLLSIQFGWKSGLGLWSGSGRGESELHLQ